MDIKALCQTPPKPLKKMKKNAHGRCNYGHKRYTARIVGSVLEVDVYEIVKDGKPTLQYRHFFEESTKLFRQVKPDGTIEYQKRIGNWLDYSISDDAKEDRDAIEEYLKETHDSADFRSLQSLEEDYIRQRRRERDSQVVDNASDFLVWLIANPPQDFYAQIKEKCFLNQRYFKYTYQRGAKQQNGECSHCGKIFTAKAKIGDCVICPKCGSKLKCVTENSWAGTPYWTSENVEYCHVVQTQDGKIIVAQEYEASISMYKRKSTKKKGSEISIKPTMCYLYHADTLKPYGCYTKRKLSKFCFGWYKNAGKAGWYPSDSRYDYPMYVTIKGYFGNISDLIPSDLKNVEFAEFGKSNVSVIAALMAVRKAPAIENLAKMGLYKLVEDFCKDPDRSDNMNCTITSPSRFIGVDKIMLKNLAEVDISYEHLQKWFSAKEIGWEMFKHLLSGNLIDKIFDIKETSKTYRINFASLVRYLEKQGIVSSNLYYYTDYMRMVKELGMPLTESIIFPKNLKQEHDRASNLMDVAKNEIHREALKNRAAMLDMLTYDNGKMLIRPLASIEDFMNESAKLSHCVKTYIKRCAEGETNIYGIRRSDAPDEPFYTLTLTNNGKVTTKLGKFNRPATKEVQDFVKEWEEKVIALKINEFVDAANKTVKIMLTT